MCQHTLTKNQKNYAVQCTLENNLHMFTICENIAKRIGEKLQTSDLMKVMKHNTIYSMKF